MKGWTMIRMWGLLVLLTAAALPHVSGHLSLGLQPDEGVDANLQPTFQKSGFGRMNLRGFYVMFRASHAKPGMFTYKFEILTPSVGPQASLASVKPSPIPGWVLTYDAAVSNKISYVATLGQELYDGWSLQIPMQVTINCNPFKDPLVVECGNITLGRPVTALLFPAVQFLCTRSSPSATCVPNGQTENWDKYEKPAAFTGSCNANAANTAPVLKFIQPDVTPSCPALNWTSIPFDLGGGFSATETVNTGTVRAPPETVNTGTVRNSATLSACTTNPAQSACTDVDMYYTPALVNADLDNLCMMMTYMSGCTIRRMCAANRGIASKYCSEWSILSDICSTAKGETMSMMTGCKTYTQLCNTTSVVLKCKDSSQGVPQLVPTMPALKQADAVCQSNSNIACSTCKGTTGKDCSDPLTTLSTVCKTMMTNSNCATFKAMCDSNGKDLGELCSTMNIGSSGSSLRASLLVVLLSAAVAFFMA